jgi:GT2 family glycosyltransferase
MPARQTTPPRVSVVIPTWNGRHLLETCLPSLEHQYFTDFEIIVVDNGSTDDTPAWLASEHPSVRLVRLADNQGFASAVNAGIRVARGEIIALLNNDTEADGRWLQALTDALDTHPEIGFCASRMLDYYDRGRVDSAGDKVGLVPSQIGHAERDGPVFDHKRRVLSASAGAAAYRHQVFDRIGLFDERFVSYFEDVDLGLRAQYAGFSCLYVPDAIVYHMVSTTASRISDTKTLFVLRNGLFVFFQYMPTRILVRWTALMLIWPFMHVASERKSWRIAINALVGLLRDLPAVRRRRREVRESRMIDDYALSNLLARPLDDIRRRVRRQARLDPHLCDPRKLVSGCTRVDAAVDVVIVNWNGRRWLGGCLDQLARSTVPVRVIVVDNASSDGSADFVRQGYPSVTVIECDTNLGYAGGANLGLRHGSRRYAMVMNPDVGLEPDHLELLMTRLDRGPEIGAAQGKLWQRQPEDFQYPGPVRQPRLDSAGHSIRRSRMVVDRGQGELDAPTYSREASIFSACGAALFLRRSMLEDLAPDGEYFDETFFAYKEDVDLCWRARILGWDIRYVPDAVAHHVRNVPLTPHAWKAMPPSVRRHSWKNHYLLMLRNDRIIDILRALPFVLGWEILRLGHAILRDPRVLAGSIDAVREARPALNARRDLFARRRASPDEIRRWFGTGAIEVASARTGMAPSPVS